MPQIWATYSEIAEATGQTPADARHQAAESGLPRRQCSDGLTRVKLPPALALQLILSMPEIRRMMDGSAKTSGPVIERLERLQAELAEIKATTVEPVMRPGSVDEMHERLDGAFRDRRVA